MAKKKNYKIKGICTFNLSTNLDGTYALAYSHETFAEMADRLEFEGTITPKQKKTFKKACTTEYEIHNLMSGEDFLKKVAKGKLSHADGIVAQVFVDGYRSNLRLTVGDFIDNYFIVDEVVWKSICKDHKVEVNWLKTPANEIFDINDYA